MPRNRGQSVAHVTHAKGLVVDGAAQPVAIIGKTRKQYFEGIFFRQGIPAGSYLARAYPMLEVA